MAELKRERQSMEPKIQKLEEKTQECLTTKEELKSDFVSGRVQTRLTVRTALVGS